LRFVASFRRSWSTIPIKRPGTRVKSIDLFDFVLDHLQERGLLEKALRLQREKGDDAVERHLVSETAPRDELVRRDAGQNFIQPLMERVGHSDAARQRRT
jgi:hypothetical protein